jgi:hypothetical protein
MLFSKTYHKRQEKKVKGKVMYRTNKSTILEEQKRQSSGLLGNLHGQMQAKYQMMTIAAQDHAITHVATAHSMRMSPRAVATMYL